MKVRSSLSAMSSQTQNPDQDSRDRKIVDYKSPALSSDFSTEEWEKVPIESLVDQVVIIHGFEERIGRFGEYMIVYAEHNGRRVKFVPPARHGRELADHLRMLWCLFRSGSRLRARIIKEWYRDFYRYTLGVPPSERSQRKEGGRK
jgi:hypothetical protein